MIRKAKMGDCEQLFFWRNNPEIYHYFINNGPISWPEHVSWFKGALKSSDCKLYVVEPNSGVVRLDKLGNLAEISVYIVPEYQGKGKAAEAINLATRSAFEHWEIRQVIATIKSDNKQSLQVFRKCGYVNQLQEKQPLGGWIQMVSY